MNEIALIINSINIIIFYYLYPRVVLSGLFESALDFKRCESNSVWEKMFLPLSLKLGLRGNYTYTYYSA